MNCTDDMHRLVIQHMEIVESLPSMAQSVELDFFQALNDRLEQKIFDRGGWSGEYDIVINEYSNETYIYPHSWIKKDYFKASFALKLDTEAVQSTYLLSHALGIHAQAPLCFCFEVNTHVYDIHERNLKKALRMFLMRNEKLQTVGFRLSQNKKCITLPVLFSPEALAECYPILDACFTPLDDAIEAIFSVLNEFTVFLESIKDGEAYLLL